MTVFTYPGAVMLSLEMCRDSGEFETVRHIDTAAPLIQDGPPNAVDTGRDLLRAFLRHQMHKTLAENRMAAGVYRIEHAGEAVIDRWDGVAMVGCVGMPHVSDCGWFACPNRYPSR